MTNCTLAALSGLTVTNNKTGNTMYSDIEYYRNTKTGKMMFSGKTFNSLALTYWKADHCIVEITEDFNQVIKVA